MVLSIRLPHVRRFYTASSIAFNEPRALQGLVQNKEQFTQTSTSSNAYPVNVLEVNRKLKELVKTGHLKDARQMFDGLSQRNVVSWTTMISGYVNASDSSEALKLFYKVWVEPDLAMDDFALSIALKACGLHLNEKHGEILHGYSVKTGFVNSVFVGSALLDMYMKTCRVWEGCRVFEEMPLRNVVSWTAIITGLVHAGCNAEALRYFSEMLRSGEEYDSYTFAIALKACANTGALNYGREIHTQATKRDLDACSFVANTLVTMYNKCGKVLYGLRLFERMMTRDVVSWTTVITTYVQMGQENHAFQLFLQMRESEVCPNEYTLAAIISACANTARMEWGEQLHAHVLIVGLLDTLSVANSIMTFYSRCGQFNSASTVFHGMSRRDIVSWSTIIAGYSQGGHGEEAFKYLSWMRKDGPKPTEFALASVLSVCGNMAILEQGKQLHAHVLSVGLEHRAMVRSSLINMYAKCGSIQEASRIFNWTENDDIVSWTAMVNGYAEHGHSKEAIDLFEKIPMVGLRPDSVTFIGVLTACSHAGLVDHGYHYFNSMSEEYGINPSKEHYGCIIDLLCRAGQLSDAEHMITSMPFTRDDVVWSTLLRACRLHGDVDRARRAAEQILLLDPNCAGTLITIANIYSAKGRWKEAADVRRLMRSKGVIKEPGWSWIKIKDQVSAFVAGDRLHPEWEDIYAILHLLASREAIQEMGSLEYDVDDLQKFEFSFPILQASHIECDLSLRLSSGSC